jgi:hypothetical protein
MRSTFRTLKIDDARALHALVVEHVESLEADLRIVGERVLLGEGAVDLVALDGEGHLVLLAVALVADDAMVLRMLEAFAWCFEYPDAVGRLYAVDPAALAVPPRVLFVSERFSDAFLRKVKHLQMSIGCLEFRYLEVNGVAGLYFNVVETPRTSPTTPAAAAAVVMPPAASTASSAASVAQARIEPIAESSPVLDAVVRATPPILEPVEPVAELVSAVEPAAARIEATEPVEVPLSAPSTDVPAAPIPEPVESVAVPASVVEPVASRVEAVVPAPPVNPVIRPTAPPSPRAPRTTTEARPAELLKGLRIPQNLSSQWQRILNRAVDAPDPAKIRVIREYLQGEFPGCVLYDFYEHEHTAQMFHVQNSQGDLMHVAAVSDDFLKTEAERDIRRFLEGNRLGRALRDAGPSSVLITPKGLRVTK